MSEWALATAEQMAWLDSKGAYECPFALFTWSNEWVPKSNYEGWDLFTQGEISTHNLSCGKLYCKITNLELAKAEGFPLQTIKHQPQLKLRIEYGPIGYESKPFSVTTHEEVSASIANELMYAKHRLIADLAIINHCIDYADSDPLPTSVALHEIDGDEAQVDESVCSIDPGPHVAWSLAHKAMEWAETQSRTWHWVWQDGFQLLGHVYGLTCGEIVSSIEPKDLAMNSLRAEWQRLFNRELDKEINLEFSEVAK